MNYVFRAPRVARSRNQKHILLASWWRTVRARARLRAASLSAPLRGMSWMRTSAPTIEGGIALFRSAYDRDPFVIESVGIARSPRLG